MNLYDRLPEIYRIKDEEQQYPGQLKSYISLFEEAFSAIHENIESLYDDQFIETCADWVCQYIGDLSGNTALHGSVRGLPEIPEWMQRIGDPWTLRADVADVIALRRRKGTMVAIERLTYNLTQWGVHCIELRENLAWNQHLNHQRPDAGGNPPYGLQNYLLNKRNGKPQATLTDAAIRGGTATLRDSAMLSLIGTPFDPFSYTADLKPPAFGTINYNLPNLAIFLWRLKAYQVVGAKPIMTRKENLSAADSEAKIIVKIQVHPLGEPVLLFNTHRFQTEGKDKYLLTEVDGDSLTQVDRTPGPIPPGRLTRGSPASNRGEYLVTTTYDENALTTNTSLRKSGVGLQIHFPQLLFESDVWCTRGADLCAWESGLSPPLRNREIVIDPLIGRIVIGVNTPEEGDSLVNHLLISYTYGSVGPVGAHPISRLPLPKKFVDGGDSSVTPTTNPPPVTREVNLYKKKTLKDALDNLQNTSSTTIIEIRDSMTHELDIGSVLGAAVENTIASLKINNSLIIRAADGQRPIIKLVAPLGFRPTKVKGADEKEQDLLDQEMSKLKVRLEGLYLTRAEEKFPKGKPLIFRAALNSVEIINCTLDPGSFRKLDGSRSPTYHSIELDPHYGFENAEEEDPFKQIPLVILQKTISGPAFIDSGYSVYLSDSIIDAGSGSGEHDVDDDTNTTASFALSGTANDPSGSWASPSEVYDTTVFGRMRVESINGRGNIWKNALEVLDNQRGCIKQSYFSASGNRLPQNHACVSGTQARLHFVSETFGHPSYGQLGYSTDFRIKERGPKDNEMGAFGFLEDAQKWRNIQVRFREFMPVGVKPLLIPVT